MKRLVSLTVLLVILALGLNGMAISAGSPNRVLLIYAYKSAHSYEQATAYIAKEIQFSDYACDIISQSGYKKGLVNKYSRVVVLNPDDNQVNGALQNDLLNYPGMICWFGFGEDFYLKKFHASTSAVSGADSFRFVFGKSSGTVYPDTPTEVEICTPVAGMTVYGRCYQGRADRGVWAYSSGRFYSFGLLDGLESSYKLQTCAGYLLGAFLGSPTGIGGVYINIDYIYPISEYNSVCAMAGYLRDKSVPFSFTVMPFYNYADTPEGAEYGKMLNYLYACGGTPIIHVPVFSPISADDAPQYTEVVKKLESSLAQYAKLDVYPTAVELPENDLLRSDMTKLFSNFSDCFTVAGNGKDVYTVGPTTKDAYISKKMSLHGVRHASSEVRIPSGKTGYGSFYEELEFLSGDVHNSCRVSFPANMKLSTFKMLIDGIMSHRVQIDDFSTGDHTVSIGGQKIRSFNGVVTYNGKAAQQWTNKPVTSSSPVKIKGSLQKTLLGGNTFVIIFSCGSIIVLILSFFVGKRIDRRKHIRRR